MVKLRESSQDDDIFLCVFITDRVPSKNILD